jgi:hypothetical protein
MQVPGFTAEASVYGSLQSYIGLAALAIGSAVRPQLKGCGPCYIHQDTGKCGKDCSIPGRNFISPCLASECVSCGPCVCTKNCGGIPTPC